MYLSFINKEKKILMVFVTMILIFSKEEIMFVPMTDVLSEITLYTSQL